MPDKTKVYTVKYIHHTINTDIPKTEMDISAERLAWLERNPDVTLVENSTTHKTKV